MKRVFCLLLAAVAPGCAPALSSFTPTHVAPKKLDLESFIVCPGFGLLGES